MRPRGGLWGEPDFVRLWGAATVSTFGSLVTRTALPFTAILVLGASPIDLALLQVAELAPAVLFGLAAGAWLDRRRRRPVLIGTDLARAALLVTIPIAALAGVLGYPQLYLVAAATSVLGVAFDVAYRSYLPAVVARERLVEGNSKLTGAAAVAEAAAFGSGGWLVQWLTAPVAILLDAVSFLVSAALVARIRTPEPAPAATAPDASLRAEIGEGLRVVAGTPLLLALAAGIVAVNLGYGAGGAVYLLFVFEELGFGAGVLGLMFAVGGVSSLAGAVAANRLTRWGVGPILVLALLVMALGSGLVPLAVGVGVGSVLLLVGQQVVGDAAATVFDIRHLSLLQAVTPNRLLGRVNASMQILTLAATLAGALLGGGLGVRIGVRATLWVQVAAFLLGALVLWRSPVGRLREAPDPDPVTA